MTLTNVHVSGGVQLDPNSPDGIEAGVEGTDEPVTGGCTDAICGITDTFTRTVSGWGTSDAGISYVTSGSDASGWSVDGNRGIHVATARVGVFLQFDAVQTLALPSTGEYDVRFDFELSTLPDLTHGYYFLRVGRYGFDGGADVTFSPFFDQVHINSGGSGDPVTVSMSGRTAVRILFGTTVQVKVWPYTEAEPASWTATRPLSGTYASEIDFQHWQILQTGILSYANTLYIDNLDVPGVNRCGAAQFDDFNRTVASGWGTATPSGYVWTATANAAAFSVDGSRGLLTYATGTIPNIEVAGGPWGENAWTMTCAFRTGSIGSVLHAVRHRFIGADINRSVWLHLATAANVGGIEMEGGAGDFESIDFSPNADYLMKMAWDGTTGVASAKVWAAAASEPLSWQVTRTWGPGTAPFTTIHLECQFWNSASYTHSIDSIDFDYDGRPCYIDCDSGLTLFDDFSNRTIVRSLSSEWGNASSGDAYTNLKPYAYVNGGYGYLEWDPTDSFSIVTAVIDPIPVASATTKTMQFRFKANRITPDGDGANELRVVWRNEAATVVATFFCYVSAENGFRYMEVFSGGDGAVSADLSWAAETWYWIKLQQGPNTMSMKRWVDGDPEPSAWDVTGNISPSLPLLDGDIALQLFPDNTGTTIIMAFDDISFGECGITDTFTRTVTSGWGTSDLGQPWVTPDSGAFNNNWSASVEGTYGRLWSEAHISEPASPWAYIQNTGVISSSFELTVRFRFSYAGNALSGSKFIFNYGGFGFDYYSSPLNTLYVSGAGSTPLVLASGAWYQMRIQRVAGVSTKIRIWSDGSTEPGAWTLETGATTFVDDEMYVEIDPESHGLEVIGPTELLLDDLDIIGVNRCGSGCVPVAGGGGGGGGGGADPGDTGTTEFVALGGSVTTAIE